MDDISPWRRLRRRLNTPGGRNTASFLIFVVIAGALWAVLSLNEEQQRDLRFRVEVSGVPDTLTYVTEMPHHITANVRGRGSDFLRYDLRHDPVITLDYGRYGTDSRLRLSSADLRSAVNDYLGGNVRVQSLSPDSLVQIYTDHPGLTVPVRVAAHITPATGYVINGTVRPDIDSVTLFSTQSLAFSVNEVHTDPLDITDLKGTVTRRVRVQAPPGARVVPRTIKVTAETEPLIFKKRTVNIDVLNTPHDMMMVTFPAQVEVSYFVPRSLYGKVTPDFKVEVDYSDTHHGSRGADRSRVPLHLTGVPSQLSGVSLSIDSVQYVLENI